MEEFLGQLTNEIRPVAKATLTKTITEEELLLAMEAMAPNKCLALMNLL